jgi:hypothetical protein
MHDLKELLQRFFESEKKIPPNFQPKFKLWIRRNYVQQEPGHDAQGNIQYSVRPYIKGLIDQLKNTSWPSKSEVDDLCQFIINKFDKDEKDSITALKHLILILTPWYEEDGTRWTPEERKSELDPFRLPKVNVMNFINHAVNFAKTMNLDLIERNPGVKGVVIGGVEDVFTIRSIAIPYNNKQGFPGLYLVNPGADEQMEGSLKDAGGGLEKITSKSSWEIFTSLIGGPFFFDHLLHIIFNFISRTFKKVLEITTRRVKAKVKVGYEITGNILEKNSAYARSKYLRFKKITGFSFIFLTAVATLFYFYSSIGGRGLLDDLNRLLFWISFSILFIILISSIPWQLLSGQEGQKKLYQNFYFLVFIENNNGKLFIDTLTGTSFGLAFFCSLMASLITWLRLPHWAKSLVEMMKRKQLLACAGISINRDLTEVKVRDKARTIKNEGIITNGLFSMFNIGDVIQSWREEPERSLKVKKYKNGLFKAKDETGLNLLCFDKLDSLIKHFKPFRWHRLVIRFFFLIVIAFAIYLYQTSAPVISLNVMNHKPGEQVDISNYKPGSPKSFRPIGEKIVVYDEMNPSEEVKLKISIDGIGIWPFFGLEVSCNCISLSVREKELRGRVYSRVRRNQVSEINFIMPNKEEEVMLELRVSDMLKRSDIKIVNFVSK